MIQVHEIDELHWSYDSTDGFPSVEPVGDYQLKVDPFPCYRHDKPTVEAMVEMLGRRAPVPRATYVNILGFEGLHRTNGWARHKFDYEAEDEEDGKKPWAGTICLSGRRTEIHPAVTRYVTVHEYGHVLEYNLAELRHGKSGVDRNDVRVSYAKLRGLKTTNIRYGGGTHHLQPGEIFANDFRYMLGVEREFWPHPVDPIFDRRGRIKNRKLHGWWREALRDLRKAAR